ncbi:MAG TPA: molybdenum cofactor guanylyltransferase [Bryobacteraceae bacterium]|nr:molybdenum cofactor guanylyltransferase [Bryobacteraceae bacterium]
MSRVSRAGFVLAGGRSSRMGRDKALLPLAGETLLDRVVRLLGDVAGSVTVIGPPERYPGYRTIGDKIENCGPLGGVYTALASSQADWNLIAACDMPELTAALLEDLFRAAEGSRADAVVPESPGGLDPLCAVYHRRCAALAWSALNQEIFKMHDFLSTLRVERLPVADASALKNVNTPEEWAAR